MNADKFNIGLMEFLDNSPTPFHVVLNMITHLSKYGYDELDLRESCEHPFSSSFFITSNNSSIIAFKKGKKRIEDSGIRLVGAHTDSPCIKIKPCPEIQKYGLLQLGVEIYGAALLGPWFDRDLSIAGRVNCLLKDNQRKSFILDFKRSIATIPSLAIHLDRNANNNRNINPQSEIVPILCEILSEENANFREILKKQIIDQYIRNDIKSVTDFDLCFYDNQPSHQIGLNGDFLASARLDNLLSCYVGLMSIIDADSDENLLLVCNDHEEVGSNSAIGAQGPFLRSVIENLCSDKKIFSKVIAKSFLISTDNAHAIHPNYENKHDPQHRPELNGGPVLKFNSNQRYTTDSISAGIFRDLCHEVNVPVQNISMRNDMACGSTIGPITAATTGIRAVDVGSPQLGMHSPRELTGWKDPLLLYRALKNFFESKLVF